MDTHEHLEYGTFEATLERSRLLEKDILENPTKHKLLTGDRPTGRLHVGHLFGSLQNRVRLHKLGVPTFIVIADYQVLTDRDTYESIAENVLQLTIDYIAAGIDPHDGKTFIFPHSHTRTKPTSAAILTLVTMAELDRNPTVKEEIAAAGLTRSTGMYTYPVPSADILSVRNSCSGREGPASTSGTHQDHCSAL